MIRGITIIKCAECVKLNFWDDYVSQFNRIRHDVLKYLELEADSSWMQGKSIRALRDEQEKQFNTFEKSMLNLQMLFDYKTTQYIQVEEDGTMKKFIIIKNE